MKNRVGPFRTLDGLVLYVYPLPEARQVQLALQGGQTLTLADVDADALACEVMHTCTLPALGLVFPRSVACRVARALRKVAVPEPTFSQEFWPYGATERAYARAEVSRFGAVGEATMPMPTTGRETLRLVRRAARAALQPEREIDALHDRVNHRTGDDRHIEAGWLRAMKGWTLADVLAGRHWPF
jgi:hypothetical protein